MKKKPHKTPHAYRPPKWAVAYLGAMLDPDVKPTVTARSEAAGIDRGTFYDAMRRPKFVEWLDSEFAEATKIELGEVRKTLVKMCLRENLEAIQLYLDRYDSTVFGSRPASEGDYTRLSEDELRGIASSAEGSAPGTRPKVN